MSDTDQGVSPERYMVVPRTLIFLTRGEKLLLLKGANTKRLWAGLYNGVGGHVEKGEDIFSSARRELFEETGLSPSNLSLCGILTVDTGNNPGVCVFILKGEYPDGEPSLSAEGELEWISVSELSGVPLVADLPVLLPRVLAFDTGDQPFIAHSGYDEGGNLSVNFF